MITKLSKERLIKEWYNFEIRWNNSYKTTNLKKKQKNYKLLNLTLEEIKHERVINK